MDYGAIIKKAWKITWQHKALWVLGLFAGATGGGWGGSGTGYRVSPQDFPYSRYVNPDVAYSYLQEWLPVIVGAIILLFLLAIVWAVIGIAARGGLVQQVNEAAEDRVVRLGAGWSTGFHYWGRLAIAGLVLLLPLLLLGLLAAFAVGMTVLVPLALNESIGAGAWAGLALVGVLLIPVSIVASFLLSNLYTLAARFIVLEDRHAVDAISASWGVIRHRLKDVFLMWLITLAAGLAFGLVIIVPVIFFAIGIGVTVALGAWPIGVLMGLALFLVLAVVGAGFSTFTSALWTVFFRRLTGREAARSAPSYAVQPPPGYPPPAAYAPSASYPAPASPPTAAPATPAAVGPPVAGYEPEPPAPVPPPVAGYAPEPPAPEPPAAP